MQRGSSSSARLPLGSPSRNASASAITAAPSPCSAPRRTCPTIDRRCPSRCWPERVPPQTTLLCSPAQLGELDIDLVLADPAVALDIGRRTVCTTAGEWAAEHIVIATGAIPRMLPNVGAPAGLHVLRTLEDAAHLRSAVTENTRVVIAGDGVLGTEIAATAAGLGATVSLIGRQRLPMAGPLGDVGGALLAQIHIEHGVNLHPQSTVRSFTESNGAVTGVVLDGGAILPADVVVVAIGATPATRWLTDSGPRIADGVICDANCAVAQGIYAAGDVARFYHWVTTTGSGWETAPTPPSKPPRSPTTFWAPVGPIHRCPTSGPTNMTPGSRSTAPRRAEPSSSSSMATCPVAASSANGVTAVRPPGSSAGTWPNRPASAANA